MNRVKAKPQPAKELGNVRTAIRTQCQTSRSTITDRTQTSNLPIIRLPGGQPVGRLVWEEGILVWERRVSAKHVWRKRNAWSINRGILEQLIALGVQLLRYTASEGDYELTLDTFLSQRECDEGAACGEDVFSVPRCRWRFLPDLQGLPLFAFEGSA